MAVPVDKIVVELEAKLARYNADVARAEQNFNRSMGSIQKSAGRAEAFVSRAVGVMGAALAGISVAALARSFLQIADEAKKLDAQLRLATQGFGSFGQAQEDVRRIAAETRSGLSETAALYGNFARNAKEIGASQGEAARATETFTKSLKISGASAAESASATLQFGQALASGALRGDELNSILEASPRLARLLAESMGTTIGQIKKLGQEGQLTSDKLLKALTDKKFTAGIDSEFKQLPVTFDEAMGQVHNAAVITFGAFDRGGEFSTMLANFITGGTEGFADLEKSAEQFGIEVRGVFAGLSEVWKPFLDTGREVFAALGIEAQNLGKMIGDYVGFQLNNMQRVANFATSPLNFALGGTQLFQFADRYQRGRQSAVSSRTNQIAEQRFNDMMRRYDVLGNRIGGGPRPASSAASTGKAGGRKAAARSPRSPLNPEAFAREEAALNDEILRLKQDEITDANERALAEMKRLETARLVAAQEIEGDERYTAAQKERLVALLGTVNALAQAKVLAERDAQVAREALDARLSTIRNEQDLLRAQADLTDSRRDRTAIELRILDLAYEQERADLEAVIASKEATDAQKKIAQQRLAILGRLQGMEAEGIHRSGESPLARYGRDLGNRDRVNDEVEQAVIDELESVRDSISSAAQKALGVKNPILAALINAFIERQLIKPFVDAMSGMGGGGGGGILGSVIGSVFGGFRANGGPVSAGKTYVVGERGPELVRMGGNGVVVPNKALKGMGGGTTVIQQTFTLDARYGVTTPELINYVNRTAQQAGQAAYTGAVRDTPVLMAKRQRFG